MRKTGISLRCKQLALSAVMMGMAMASHAITLTGSTVNFTFDETALGLFSGAYAVSGDTLTFSPSAFVNNGNDYSNNSLGEAITITVTPKAGWQFSSLHFEESGLYTYTHVAPYDDVYVTGQLRIFDPLVPAVVLTPSIPNAIPVPSTPVSNAAWNATINQSLATLTTVPEMKVTVENILYALDDPFAPTDNMIRKDLVQLNVITTPVPEVETWAMMLAGVGLIGLQLRRRKSSSARVIR